MTEDRKWLCKNLSIVSLIVVGLIAKFAIKLWPLLVIVAVFCIVVTLLGFSDEDIENDSVDVKSDIR